MLLGTSYPSAGSCPYIYPCPWYIYIGFLTGLCFHTEISTTSRPSLTSIYRPLHLLVHVRLTVSLSIYIYIYMYYLYKYGPNLINSCALYRQSFKIHQIIYIYIALITLKPCASTRSTLFFLFIHFLFCVCVFCFFLCVWGDRHNELFQPYRYFLHRNQDALRCVSATGLYRDH